MARTTFFIKTKKHWPLIKIIIRKHGAFIYNGANKDEMESVYIPYEHIQRVIDIMEKTKSIQ